MTKNSGEPPKPITKAERDARKAFRQVEAEKAMTEHELAQKAFSQNRERLKAERLAREAAAPPPTKPKTVQGEGEMSGQKAGPANQPQLGGRAFSRLHEAGFIGRQLRLALFTSVTC